MHTMQAEKTFDYPVAQVFEVVTTGIINQQKQRGVIQSFSHTQPIGTEVTYDYERFGQTVQATFKITGFKNNRLFEYRIQIDDLQSIMQWQFRRLNKNRTNVLYIEKASSPNFWIRMQFRFLGWMKSRQFKKQAAQYFTQLEETLSEKYKTPTWK